jgi:hypothetical protein
MKLETHNLGVLMAVVAIASVGALFALSQSVFIFDNPSAPNGMLMTGNVKVTQTNSDGDIVAIRQGDNHIVLTGMELIVGQVFNTMNETNAGGAHRGLFTHPLSHIEIGTGGETLPIWNNTELVAPVSAVLPACIRNPITVANVSAAARGSEAAPSSCSPGASCAAQYNVTATATFDGNLCNPVGTIDEAGIWDDPANDSGLMFARNTFGGVVLQPGDSLALDWEFTFTDNIN